MRPALEAQTRPHRSHVNPERFAGVGGAAGAGVGADGDEKESNPFMRIMQPAFAGLAAEVNGSLYKVMDLVREKKNQFVVQPPE
ncbi:hypothetical protein M8J75_016445 [Diaphorina citri]|nr:hypothetical protein M8J75_016445 [Diaphorina citri]